EELDPITQEFFEYYVTDRGRHPHATGAFTVTSAPSHISYGGLRYLDDLMPRPILVLAGEHAHSRSLSETIYQDYNGPKELVIVSDANHIDLYDRVEMIPFDTIEDFFRSSL
ncbi:MAG: alpha/beta hydrolase, partial [Corynebacterium sp.]|nr:alpha/beta hydrolase [Corynebacterium sp.]